MFGFKFKYPESPKTMFRQGDVLIKRINKINPEAKPAERDEQDRVVLAYGEVTGHAHAIHDPGVVAMMIGDDHFLSVPNGGAEVVHEEHDTIVLSEGTYEVTRQREWTGNDQNSHWAYVAD